jgi:hypothetical protein
MRELRERGSRSAVLHPPVVHGLPNTAQLTGFPVHLIDGKWYVDLTPQGSYVSVNEARGLLKIQEQLENGAVKRSPVMNRIQVWEDGHWLEFDEEGLVELGLTFAGDFLTPSALQKLKAWKEVRDEEDERLALRQLLAESQEEGDDETG